MRAFALEELKAHREADDAVRNVMPIRRGEFDWLGQNWPEMRAFLSNIRQ